MADYGYGADDFGGSDAGMDNYDVSNFTGTPISWEDEYAKLIGVSPNNDPSAPSPSNDEILKNINFGSSDITSAINKMMGSNFTGKQLASMAAAAGGGIAGLMGALNPKVNKAGYQGGIPEYEAVRNMVTAPPTKAQGYRPGQGGINYGGDVSYVPKGSSAALAPAASGGGSSMLGDIAKVAGVGGLGYLASKYLTGDNSPFKGVTTDFTSRRVGDGSTPNTADNGMISDMQYRGQPTMSATQDEGNAMDRNVDWTGSFAAGGLANLAKGRYLQGETDGMADKIPAKIGEDQPAALSHGEFVVPADVVSHLGNGNSDAGAKKLYGMMDKIRQARTGTKKQGKQINPDKFMPGGLAQAYANGGSVMRFADGGGVGSAAAAGVTGVEQGPNTWAGGYMSNLLGKTQALANAPYQQYMGPLTAGESGLQSKVFGGLQNMNFPSNLGQSFSSTGAYQPPQLNMGAYQQQPIGTGNYTRPSFEQYTSTLGSNQQPAVNKNVYDAGLAGSQIYDAAKPAVMPAMEYGVPGSDTFGTTAQPSMMLNQGSNGFGDFGSMQAKEPLDFGAPGTADYIDRNNLSPSQSLARELQEQQRIQNAPNNLPGLSNLFNRNMQATTGLQNVGPAQRQTYEDYLTSIGDQSVVPQNREQFEQSQNQIDQMRRQGMDMLGRGDMNEIMAGLGGQPGQMPPSGMGGLAGLAGRMPQQPQQPQQQSQGIAQQYMNPYLQSVLTPQMEELRRQAQINNMSGLGALTKSGAFGGGRQAIMESEAGRNLLQEQNKTIGAGYANAFDKAMGQFNTEQARDLGLAKFMSDQGGVQRGIESEGIAADKAAFEEARLNPYKMAQFQQSMLNGMPISATNYNIAQPTNFLQAAAGGATTAADLLDILTGNKPAKKIG